MRDKTTPDGQPDDARVQRAILNLILDPDRQRPLSEPEIARAIGHPQQTAGALEHLYCAGLIHRWNGLLTATHPAVRQHELIHGERSSIEDRDELLVLEVLIEQPSEEPPSEADLERKLAEDDPKRRIDVLDALDRLDRAGLIDRRGQRVHPARVVLCLDALSL